MENNDSKNKKNISNNKWKSYMVLEKKPNKKKITMDLISARNDNFKSIIGTYFKNPINIMALVFLGLFLIFVLLSPFFTSDDGLKVQATLDAPLSSTKPYIFGGDNKSYLFGTDQLGRDIWSIFWKDMNGLILKILIITVFDIIFGLTIGGIFGMKIDYRDKVIASNSITKKINWFILGMAAFIQTILFSDNNFILAMSIGFISWIPVSHSVFTKTIEIVNKKYIKKFKLLGHTDYKIFTSDILPKIKLHFIYICLRNVVIYIGISFLFSIIISSPDESNSLVWVLYLVITTDITNIICVFLPIFLFIFSLFIVTFELKRAIKIKEGVKRNEN